MRSAITRPQTHLKALITGASGFVGKHLVRSLLVRGWQVFGFDQHTTADVENLYVGDLMNRGVLSNVLKECQPDVVFHLAGLIKSPRPELMYKVNLVGTVTLLESITKLGLHPAVIVTSSSAVYGSGFKSKPITERFQPRPVTHYAVSKLLQEVIALRYFDMFRLPVSVVRMFNLLGPGQSPDLACSAFARQIALAEANGQDEMVTGDLNARRDFVDVRDAVRAFILIAENGKAGQIYNICSGRAVLMRKCLNIMLAMSMRQLKVQVDLRRVQQNDVPIQIGSAHKLNQVTGWHPQISLRQSLFDLLEYWRQRVQSELE